MKQIMFGCLLLSLVGCVSGMDYFLVDRKIVELEGKRIETVCSRHARVYFDPVLMLATEAAFADQLSKGSCLTVTTPLSQPSQYTCVKDAIKGERLPCYLSVNVKQGPLP